MRLSSPESRTSSKRATRTILILVMTLIFSLLLVFGTLFMFKDKDKSFNIKFYDHHEELIETITLKDDEVITQEQIEYINSLIDVDNNYYIEWSYRKNELIPVDFSKLYTNTNVYLFLIKNEYTVDVAESDLYTYEIDHDGVIKYGSDVLVTIKPNVNLNHYHMEVSINGEIYENNEDYTYQINNIKEDVIVNVTFKEIVEINAIFESKLVYNNMSHFVTYSLLNKEANFVDSTDVSVTYINELGKVVPHMKDAGIYEVILKYVGDEYYCEDEVKVEVVIDKAIPTFEIINNEFYYDGNIKSLSSDDIITNSNGIITFTNNSNINPGSYKVLVEINETNNYYGYSEEVDVVINKGIPKLESYPIVDIGFEYNTLSSVKLNGGKANVEGVFKWVDPSKYLEVGIKPYKVEFIPDNSNYETIEFEIEVETISTVEALRRIKKDRELLYSEFNDVLSGNVYGLSGLPINGEMYDSNITWLSNTTSMSVDKLGNISLLNNVDKVNVTLLAYITLGNTAEYATFEFTLHLVEELNVIENEETLIIETIVIPTIEEIVLMVSENNTKELEKIDISSYMISQSPKDLINNQNIESYNNKEYVLETNELIKEEQTLDYVYKARCNRKRTISEVILWKIISDSAGSNGGCSKMCIPKLKEVLLYRWIPDIDDGVLLYRWIPDKDKGLHIRTSQIKYEEKQKDINLNFMKGEI